MKALILAAGKGSRLGGLTEDTPKSMLELNANDTLLSYNLRNIAQIGIQNVILVTGFQHEKCENYASTICKELNLDLEVIYNPFWNYCNVLGSMYLALDAISDDFLFLHADTLLDKEALMLLKNASGEAVLTVDKKECREEEMKVILVDHQITAISKALEPSESHGEFVGIAKFGRQMIPYFKQTSKKLFSSGNLNLYMEAVLQHAIETNEKQIEFIDTSKFRSIEIDFEEDLLEARRLFNEN